MSIHRFIEFRTVDHARLALRGDGSLWLLGDAERPCRVDRGSGWAAATRLCLCAGDRLRLGERELSAAELCRLAGLEPGEAAEGSAIESDVPGIAAPVPLRMHARVMEKARRDPGTGQIEALGKERE